ncbi:GNAT family N-acetyltransferase [Natrinema salsiterrestre]|uniref:GNAT family N-acetyltransferase n=1 Tax=Natrinema salsiterrestre TaxID=2950540 RepID=A0A9Q4KYZ5_9EURY|nr:GNAT family N-acetyltransferase [Natrinema salsiterrestre]MDF9744249.1 GNAT family N-acetyltransferase [Natrinema salsiterrestre]
MGFYLLPADEAAVRRYVGDLWLPYHRELEAIVDAHALADTDTTDLLAAEVEFRLERLETNDYRTWVAVDESCDGDSGGRPLADGELAGFVATEIDESPPVFDRPDRLVVTDIYVREPYRGTGLADDLIDRATKRAREATCTELALEVDVDNDRAIAFYEKRGFETDRRRMTMSVDGS